MARCSVAIGNPSLAASGLERLGGPPAYALLATLMNVFPLPRKSGFRKSFVFAGESVERGYGVVVFPEGVRTPNGALSPFLPGIGLLAQGLRLPVLPAFIQGLFALKAAGRRIARPGEVSVIFGDPVVYERGQAPEAIAKDLERRVARAPGVRGHSSSWNTERTQRPVHAREALQRARDVVAEAEAHASCRLRTLSGHEEHGLLAPDAVDERERPDGRR